MNFFFFSQGWTYLVPVWTLFGPVLGPCGLVAHLYLICGPMFDYCGTVAHLWLICGSLLDRIGFLRHFVIALSIGIVCVIAVL